MRRAGARFLGAQGCHGRSRGVDSRRLMGDCRCSRRIDRCLLYEGGREGEGEMEGGRGGGAGAEADSAQRGLVSVPRWIHGTAQWRHLLVSSCSGPSPDSGSPAQLWSHVGMELVTVITSSRILARVTSHVMTF